MTSRIGVDVGGTTLRVRRYPGTQDDRVEEPTGVVGGEAVAERIALLVGQLPPGERPSVVGIGIPGLVDPVAGTVRHAVNLGIDGAPFPLAGRLSRRLGLPVAVENDVRTAALGAFQYLAERLPEVRDIVYLSVGTGISAGVVIDGRLHRGRHGIAGEIGHAPLGGDSTPCRCGLAGCLEAVAGGRALDEVVPGGAHQLFAEPSPDQMRRDSVADALARALYVLAIAYDPDILVIGGGIGPDAAPTVRKALAALSASSPFGEAVLAGDRVTTLPPDAEVGTAGAALLEPSSAPADDPQGGEQS
ncbi:MAG TPA: ROK family protein [Acidimicrobiia bacterium]|nr:ROK family protein [Acidimicrobiia bacterium]